MRGYEDVVAACDSVADRRQESETRVAPTGQPTGYVYLLKFGRFYKIGRSNAPGRREYEIALQLPEKERMVHSFSADDPSGIEAYWHRRFEARRRHGEWFELTAQDVAAFKNTRNASRP